MTDVLVPAILTLAVVGGWIGVARLTRSVHHTSLTSAAAWAIWFQATLTATTSVTLAKNQVPRGILDQLWYLTAVSALCPFVAVLGARRGRLLEWSLFIVMPLIVVLEWPALAQLTRCWHGQRLELEAPALIGFALVLVMALGQFFGTRYPISILTWMATWGIVGWSLRSSTAASLADRNADQRIAVFFLVQFWLAAAFETRTRPVVLFGWNRVWNDYRNFFGNLWALRLMARVNEIARRDNWPWTLTENGLSPVDPKNAIASDPDSDPRVDHTFRWLMKPFVDPEWIDKRLTASRDRASGG
ncbi:MAG: hypothetical protein FJ302_12305 [Planctomycetes bacterium]|nr:hypothetical protein [Planctomycetota bacterium]